MSPPRTDPLRDQTTNQPLYSFAASAPYVATLWLRGGGQINLTLPGMGDHVLTGPGQRGERLTLEAVPSWPEGVAPQRHPTALGATYGLGTANSIALRLEKGLGDGTGLGADGAAWLAGALSVAAFTGRSLDPQELIEVGARDLGTSPEEEQRWRAVLRTAMLGGICLTTGEETSELRWDEAPGIIAVMPGEAHGRLPLPHPADLKGGSPKIDPEAAQAVRQGDLEALQAHLVQPQSIHPAWRLALDAARDAGALCTAIADGGTSILALSPDPQQAREIRAATIAAFGEAGVWSRGRSGRPGQAARAWKIEDWAL